MPQFIRPVSRLLLLFCLALMAVPAAKAQSTTDTSATDVAIKHFLDSIDATIPYVTEGSVDIFDVARIQLPKGYKFIPAGKARMIVEDLWKNPKDSSIGGMIVKSDFTVGQSDSWAFVISYDESGYVKDKDADDIDYDKMLKDIQETEKETNKQRVEAGFPPIHLLAWAARPFYDKKRKILHWARKIQFGTEPQADNDLALNYDIRILGRKGILSMNAVGSMAQLADINNHIPDVLDIAQFKSGYTYSDFNPSGDKVAAYTIGGLIAGKLIAKTGLFVLLLKYIKLIAFAIMGVFAGLRKKLAGWFSRNKNKDDGPGSEVPGYEKEMLPEPAAIVSSDLQGDNTTVE